MILKGIFSFWLNPKLQKLRRRKMRNGIYILVIAISILLTGCSADSSQSGFFHQTFVEPFSMFIKTLAEWFNGNYGIAIILITLIIRLVLMPLMLRQYKQQQSMKEKMNHVMPKMKELQEKFKKAKDQEEQRKIQMEMMELYRTNGINPLGMGCLPIIIQLPIVMGLYYAIRGSKEIASHSFLWFDLGSPDVILTLIAAAVYFLQFKVSMRTIPDEQLQGPMKMMGVLSPLMIGMASIASPAALPLYWSVSGTFLILQTLLSQKLYYKPEQKEKSAK